MLYEVITAYKILDPFVLTVERRRAMPVIGDPDEDVVARVRAFSYNFV